MVFAETGWNFNKKDRELTVEDVDGLIREINLIGKTKDFPPLALTRERDLRESISRLKNGEKFRMSLGEVSIVIEKNENNDFNIKTEGL